MGSILSYVTGFRDSNKGNPQPQQHHDKPGLLISEEEELLVVLPEDLEQECIDKARELGAGGITLIQGRGISNETRKTFFGFAYDGNQSVLLMVLEKGLSLDILKAIQKILMPDHTDSQGLVFTLPLEHLGGIDMSQVEKFEQHLKCSLYPENNDETG